MPVKFTPVSYNDEGNEYAFYVDEYGKLRMGVVEYIKLIAQKPSLSGVTVGIGTTTPTTYNTILIYPVPLHSNDVGEDYTESTLSVTAAAGATASGTGSVSATFVSTLRNKFARIKGDVIAQIMYYYASSATTGTVEVTTIDVEIGKIDTESGTKTSLASKTITVNRSTTGSVEEAITVIFENMDFKLNEGERMYLSVTVNYSFTVDASGSTTSVTDTASVRIDHYRGSDDTCLLLPVVM